MQTAVVAVACRRMGSTLGRCIPLRSASTTHAVLSRFMRASTKVGQRDLNLSLCYAVFRVSNGGWRVAAQYRTILNGNVL